MEKKIIDNDMLLSNWALAVYILYMLNIITFSPKLLLIIALIVATCTIIGSFFANKLTMHSIIAYILFTFFCKLIPLYTVRQDKITKNVIIYTLIVLIIYLLYLDVKQTSFLNVYIPMAYNHPTKLGIYYKNLVKMINN